MAKRGFCAPVCARTQVIDVELRIKKTVRDIRLKLHHQIVHSSSKDVGSLATFPFTLKKFGRTSPYGAKKKKLGDDGAL